MKKLYFLIALFTFANLAVFGQIALESTIPALDDDSYLFHVKFSTGDKFATVDRVRVNNEVTSATLKIYSVNHSLEKTITVPLLTPGGGSRLNWIYIANVSDNLFKTDAKVEYLINYETYNTTTYEHGYFVRVWDEDGTSVFSKDSAEIGYIATNGPDMNGVINASSGPKLIIQNQLYNNKSIELYSLPGTLLALNSQPMKKGGDISIPVPNPSSETTRIEFELPEGENTGEITVFNIEGILLKKYVVDNTFGDLLLNNADLPSGTYYYQLKSGQKLSSTKKMMVIN